VPVAIAVAGLVLLLPASSTSDTICKEIHLKPVHRVCGTALDISGGPVARATVTVLKDGARSASFRTGEDGKFSLDELPPGTYQFQIEAKGFLSFQFPIVMDKPESKCKRALEITLSTGYPVNCTGVRLVKRWWSILLSSVSV
jgi:hypothetical protein